MDNLEQTNFKHLSDRILKNKDNFKYIEIFKYFDDNFENIINEINDTLYNNHYNLILYISYSLASNLTKDDYVEIKEWYDDGCPYDHSGRVTTSGYKYADELDLREFLEECYTGFSEATYVSHYGLRWTTYEEEVSDLISKYAYFYFYGILVKYIKSFNVETEDDLDDIYYIIEDDFYDNSNFMCYNFYDLDNDFKIIEDKYLDMSLLEFIEIWRNFASENNIKNDKRWWYYEDFYDEIKNLVPKLRFV